MRYYISLSCEIHERLKKLIEMKLLTCQKLVTEGLKRKMLLFKLRSKLENSRNLGDLRNTEEQIITASLV